MRIRVVVLLALGLSATGSWAQTDTQVSTIKPKYLPPAELVRILGVHEHGARDLLEWGTGADQHSVEVRRNDGANLIILTGTPGDVAAVEAMVKVVDVPPRQILVEARIVEVDRNKALDAGIDVSRISTFANSSQDLTNEVSKRRSSTVGVPELEGRDQIKVDRRRLSTAVGISQFLSLLDESGAATFRDAPRILTINNRRATILDGQRVTYVTRYSSFTNLFETDTLDAGLTLSVLPSLGESGYLTLDIRAELTTLRSEISGSPVKDGQIVENTVMVKDGESILLGGFQRTTEERVHRRFPLLGHVLPFLFSREIVKKTTRESFVVLTPRVVDLATGLDSRTREVIQGR